MPIKSLKEAKEIVKFVEGDDGLPRLDNMIREDRYAEAKISLAAMDFPEIKALVETGQDYIREKEYPVPDRIMIYETFKRFKEALSNLNRALGKGS